MNKMRCGACGADHFEIHLSKGNKDFPEEIVVKCLKCLSTSIIKIIVPKMQILFGENSEGRLSVF